MPGDVDVVSSKPTVEAADRAAPPTAQPGFQATAAAFATFASFLGHLHSVVGAGAAQALIRYGAFEEGKRLGFEAGGTLAEALSAFDALFDQETTLTSTGEDAYEAQVRSCNWLTPTPSSLDLVAVGLYEGLLLATVRRRFKGEVVSRGDGGRGVLLFSPDESTS